MNRDFWRGKTVLITGHNGFKGCWLTKWLDMAGANVVGCALPSENSRQFQNLKLSERFVEVIGDIANPKTLNALTKYQFDIVFHLAAQAIVKTAAEKPFETFLTNVMGTVNLLEMLRNQNNLKAVVVVTSDKVYQNIETEKGYFEEDPLGGSEPYSCSKVCEEQVVKAYYEAYFKKTGIGFATARGSNCFGGGDYHFDRLIPYLEKCREERFVPEIRNPGAVRPWQFVLDLLNGYLYLAEFLSTRSVNQLEGFNFGPDEEQLITVGELARKISGEIKDGSESSFFEAKLLTINSKKSNRVLGWSPVYSIEQAIEETNTAYEGYFKGIPESVIYEECIKKYEDVAEAKNAG